MLSTYAFEQRSSLSTSTYVVGGKACDAELPFSVSRGYRDPDGPAY
jgi:hypothetical protein